MTAIVSTLQNIISALFGTNGAVPTFFTWLTSEGVVEYFLIGVSISVLLLGIRIVKSIFWAV